MAATKARQYNAGPGCDYTVKHYENIHINKHFPIE